MSFPPRDDSPSDRNRAPSPDADSSTTPKPNRPPRRRLTPSPEAHDGQAHAPPASLINAPLDEVIPLGKDDFADIPPMPQEMIDAWYDDKEEAPKVGYKKPPKGSQFQKGQSGNPSGSSNRKEPPPGNVLQNLGHEVVDEITRLLEGHVGDLPVHVDDPVTTALAKVAVGDALKKDGSARKFVFSQFLEKPLQSERLAPVDAREEETRIMQKMLSSIFDPAATDEDREAVLKEASEHHETYGEFGARRRRERKKRRKPRRKA